MSVYIATVKIMDLFHSALKMNYHKPSYICYWTMQSSLSLPEISANTLRRVNAALIVAHRFKRWPNISHSFGRRLVFAGIGSHRFQIQNFVCVNGGILTLGFSTTVQSQKAILAHFSG